MHRLFVALRPPAPIRASLLGLMGGIAGARWQDDDQLHVTLRFIGEVERPVAEDVAATLGSIRHPPLSFRFSGLGTFDHGGSVDTLWARVVPFDGLTILHKKIDQALVRIGLAPERRTYLPHVTLARLGSKAGPVQGFLAENAGFSTEPIDIDWFALFESSLGTGGARYDMIARYPLTS
jgi:RNA 2',3'-cyclic 3'-phosphodiesterase